MAEADARVGGRYRLDRRLASGAMGAVWQGWDERLQRPVAIKRLHLQPSLPRAERAAGVERMMREGRIAARLRHPNAVQVYDVVADVDDPCLVMEYVPSRSLQQIVSEDAPLPPREVARIGTQVAAALAAAHRAGIVHRDVKPGNVLVTEEGAAKITDFGISHALDDITLTSVGMLTGTPSYLAPEVARGAASDYASDVYALGATLYMAVEGHPPFGTDENPMAVLDRVASGDWEPPVRSGPLTPVLLSMMATEAAARPTMVDVANTLPDLHPLTTDVVPTSLTPIEAIADESPTSLLDVLSAGDTRMLPTPPPAPPPPLVERARSQPPWLAILAALLVVAVGTVAAVLLLRGSGGGGLAADVRSSLDAQPSGATAHSATRSGGPSRPAGRSANGPAKQTGAPTARQLAAAIVDYFRLVPGDLNAGWARLTPHFQRTKAQNRRVYDDFWHTVDRVDVRNVTGLPPHHAAATLVYHYKNGQVVTQRTVFRLVRQGGLLKIDRES